MSNIASRYGAFLDSLDLNRRHWIIFAVCAAGFMFDAADFKIMALVAPSIAREWGLDSQ
jgi:putative MFS transporter